MASSANVELRALAPGPENNGAGGSGRLGLPPYLEEGVPGLGTPLISEGSNWIPDGGGLPSSDEPREGVQGRVGDVRPVGEYPLYTVSGGGIDGKPSTKEGARECDD